MKRGSLKATAYHEAGHAVASFVLRIPFHHVTIIPDDDTGSAGHLKRGGFGRNFRPDIHVDARVERQIADDIMMTFAGPAAEARHRGRRNHVGASHDYDMVMQLGCYVVGSEKELSAYVALLSIRADQLVASARNWVAIDALAKALLEKKRIGSTTARRIILGAIAEAVSWPAARKRKLTRAVTGTRG